MSPEYHLYVPLDETERFEEIISKELVRSRILSVKPERKTGNISWQEELEELQTLIKTVAEAIGERNPEVLENFHSFSSRYRELGYTKTNITEFAQDVLKGFQTSVDFYRTFPERPANVSKNKGDQSESLIYRKPRYRQNYNISVLSPRELRAIILIYGLSGKKEDPSILSAYEGVLNIKPNIRIAERYLFWFLDDLKQKK